MSKDAIDEWFGRPTKPKGPKRRAVDAEELRLRSRSGRVMPGPISNRLNYEEAKLVYKHVREGKLPIEEVHRRFMPHRTRSAVRICWIRAQKQKQESLKVRDPRLPQFQLAPEPVALPPIGRTAQSYTPTETDDYAPKPEPDADAEGLDTDEGYTEVE